jgi:phosphatidylserine/phosphatidylglycerophosphate/cardiolipin synthase-like enzyme
MHAKMIVGTKAGFIGSQNFSITSINYNREVGVIMSGRENMQILDQEFSADYSAAVNGSAAPGGYSGYHAYHSYGNTTSNGSGGGVVSHVMGNIASHFLRHKILGNW